MSFAGFSLIDIFFILLCCYFVVRGAFRGFLGEVTLLVGFFAAFYVAIHFSHPLSSLLSGFFGLSAGTAQITAMVVLWVAVIVAAALLRKLLQSFASAVSLGGIDRLLGAGAGLLKTVVVVYLVLVAGFLAEPVLSPEWMGGSRVLVQAGRYWPDVRHTLVNFGALPQDSPLPDMTLEEVLRPYRRGTGGPAFLLDGGENYDI